MFNEWYVCAMKDNEETCHCGHRYDPTQYDGKCYFCQIHLCDGTPNCVIAQENS